MDNPATERKIKSWAQQRCSLEDRAKEGREANGPGDRAREEERAKGGEGCAGGVVSAPVEQGGRAVLEGRVRDARRKGRRGRKENETGEREGGERSQGGDAEG